MIVELVRRFDAGEPIVWPRRVALPDFIDFPHHRHVAAGTTCAECHGAVRESELAPKKTFRMKDCMSCHQRRAAPVDCVVCHK